LNREEAKSAKEDWKREEIPFATFKKLCGLPFFAENNDLLPKGRLSGKIERIKITQA